VGQRADVVVVAVRQNDRLDILFFLFEILDVRNDVVDARRFVFGELQTDVDDDDFIFIFEEHAVAANFFKAAERHEAKTASGSIPAVPVPFRRGYHEDAGFGVACAAYDCHGQDAGQTYVRLFPRFGWYRVLSRLFSADEAEFPVV
jgi:hypothetical protein